MKPFSFYFLSISVLVLIQYSELRSETCSKVNTLSRSLSNIMDNPCDKLTDNYFRYAIISKGLFSYTKVRSTLRYRQFEKGRTNDLNIFTNKNFENYFNEAQMLFANDPAFEGIDFKSCSNFKLKKSVIPGAREKDDIRPIEEMLGESEVNDCFTLGVLYVEKKALLDKTPPPKDFNLEKVKEITKNNYNHSKNQNENGLLSQINNQILNTCVSDKNGKVELLDIFTRKTAIEGYHFFNTEENTLVRSIINKQVKIPDYIKPTPNCEQALTIIRQQSEYWIQALQSIDSTFITSDQYDQYTYDIKKGFNGSTYGIFRLMMSYSFLVFAKDGFLEQNIKNYQLSCLSKSAQVSEFGDNSLNLEKLLNNGANYIKNLNCITTLRRKEIFNISPTSKVDERCLATTK